MKKNILFLWPPQTMFHGSLFKHITHIGETLDYIANNIDCNLKFFDAGVELFSSKQFVETFKKTDYLYIYCEVYTIENSIKIAKMAKQVNPKIRIMGFGKACCYMPNYYINSGYYDAIVDNGFWEKPMIDFAHDYISNDSAQMITKKGKIGKIKPISSKEWGIPKVDLLPLETYFKLTNKRQLEIAVAKGCPYNCSFCSEKYVYGKEEGRRTVDSVIKFIEETHDLCDSYYFDAPTFTYDEEWVKDLCQKIIGLPYKITWCAVTRLDEIDEELIKIMSEAGCYRLSVGVETLNKNVQLGIRKVINYDMMIDTFRMLKKYNITPRALLIIGLPGQTKEDIKDALELIKEEGLDYRVKEYAPYNDILNDNSTIEQIRRFDRTEYISNDVKIDNLTEKEYMEIIFADKGR